MANVITTLKRADQAGVKVSGNEEQNKATQYDAGGKINIRENSKTFGRPKIINFITAPVFVQQTQTPHACGKYRRISGMQNFFNKINLVYTLPVFILYRTLI